MPDIEIKRGYEVLPDNNVRFGIRVINSSNFAISDVEVILDYNESLFGLEGNKIQKLGTIPPAVPRTAKFILKPLGCVHKEEIGATVIYKDSQWKKHTEEMRPKEVHCVCPFMREKSITRAEFLKLINTGYSEERGINFEGLNTDKMVSFLANTCKNRLYKVDEFSIENGKIIYLAGDAVGDKAYYLLTAVVKDYEGLTQVLLRANSDKNYGLNGFLNEIMDNLRHLVLSANAKEIGIIKKEQVINIIDSVVQRTSFSVSDTTPSVNIQGSVLQRTEIREDEEKKKREEEKLIEESSKVHPEQIISSSGLNRFIIACLIILIVAGLIWVFLPMSGKVSDNRLPLSNDINAQDKFPKEKSVITVNPAITATPAVTVQLPVSDVTPIGNKVSVKVNRDRGYVLKEQTNLKIKLGDEVIWINEGSYPLTLVSNDGLFEDKILDYDKLITHIFTKSGTYGFDIKVMGVKKFSGTVTVEP